MRIVYLGAVDFSLHCLKEVIANDGDVVSVLTLSPEHAGFHSDYADLAPLASRHGIPVHRIRRINDRESVDLLRSLEPDVMFVFGWSQIVSPEVLGVPPLGCIGSHPALLSRNRGRHPIVWALAEGLEESGLTFFYLDQGADSGDILWQKAFSIALDDDDATVYGKLKGLASEAIGQFLPLLQRGVAPRLPQDHSQATYWRKRTEEDGEIYWEGPTMRAYNLVRALARPYVGAHTFRDGRRLKVWRARSPEAPSPQAATGGAPGQVVAAPDGAVAVRTGDGFLTLLEYELDGGERLEAGAVLGPVK